MIWMTKIIVLQKVKQRLTEDNSSESELTNKEDISSKSESRHDVADKENVSSENGSGIDLAHRDHNASKIDEPYSNNM